MININTLCLEDTNIHLGDLDTKQPKKLNLSYKYKSSKDRLLSTCQLNNTDLISAIQYIQIVLN